MLIFGYLHYFINKAFCFISETPSGKYEKTARIRRFKVFLLEFINTNFLYTKFRIDFIINSDVQYKLNFITCGLKAWWGHYPQTSLACHCESMLQWRSQSYSFRNSSSAADGIKYTFEELQILASASAGNKKKHSRGLFGTWSENIWQYYNIR